MANNLYTTKTAALKATKADINRLDAKKLSLNGKNILDYISESGFNSYDPRDPQLKNDKLDIWNTEISLSDNGHIEVKPFEHDYNSISSTAKTTIRNAFAVRNNEVFDADNNHVMYWQTDGLTNGGGILGGFSNVVTFDSDMPSLTCANDMFTYTPSLTSFNGDLSSLVEAKNMFFISELTSFTSDLSSLQNGDSMFAECYNLSDFTCKNLDSLIYGNGMFSDTSITSFEMNLSSLAEGENMFRGCPNLTTFIGDLSSLKYGDEMFFFCENLSTFIGDLSSLVYGDEMFSGCSLLTSFTSPIPSLISAKYMFEECKLDAPSVTIIADFIADRGLVPPSYYLPPQSENLVIGVGIPNTEAAKQAFAEECFCDSWDELTSEFTNKSWNIQWQFNGDASTFDLRGEKPSTAVYARLEEVFMPTEEEIAAAKDKGERIKTPHYQYTSQDGDNYYNIHWYHDSNTNNEGYDYFESLEMATLAYSVIPKA